MTDDNSNLAELAALLESNLGLAPGTVVANPATRLLGVLPELDSMSVVTFLISLEEEYGIEIHDDEVDASLFETLGSISKFLQTKIGSSNDM